MSSFMLHHIHGRRSQKVTIFGSRCGRAIFKRGRFPVVNNSVNNFLRVLMGTIYEVEEQGQPEVAGFHFLNKTLRASHPSLTLIPASE